jgi:hypothetical protein
MAKVEIELQVIIKLLRLLVPKMQLSKKITLQKLLYEMPLMLLYILFKLGLNLGVYRSIQGQYN